MNILAESVLDPDIHARLISDIDGVCLTANIPQYMLHQSAKKSCSPEELEWLIHFQNYRRTGHGLVITGNPKIGPDHRLMALTAALVRNFIDARVIPLNQILDGVEKGTVPEPTVLMIPNLYVNMVGGKTLPAWRAGLLYDLLLSRGIAGKPTVAYVESMDAMELSYGPQIARYVEQHCKIVSH